MDKIIIAVIGVVALVVGTAWGTAYFLKASPPVAEEAAQPVHIQHARVYHHQRQQAEAVAVAEPAPLPPCDDGNVLGYVAGAAAGGIAGHQVGKGSGNTAATIAGTLGGAYLGGKHLPLKNVTCR